MAEYTLFPAKIVTPEGVAFEGEVRELEVTSTAGGLGILARRAPIVADLKMGHVRAQMEDGSWTTWASADGFAQAADSTATVITEETIKIDEGAAQYAATTIERANEKLASLDSGDENAHAAAMKAIAWGKNIQRLAERK